MIEVYNFLQGENQAHMQRTALRLAKEIASEWRRIARSSLNSTAADYSKAITVVEASPSRVAVALTNRAGDQAYQTAKMIEDGKQPYDMLPALLRSAKARRGKDGHSYINIPFRRRGRKSTVAGAPEIERLSNQRILGLARRLTGRLQSTQGVVRPGQSLKTQMIASKLKAHHATDALSGLQRETQINKSGREITRGFLVWRRASLKSRRRSSLAWRHPGIKARGLAKKVEKKLPRIIKEVV